MTALVPIMLLGWIPFTIILFLRLPPHRAVLFSMIGGWLFLPMAEYDLEGLPALSKATAISLSLIFGSLLSGSLLQKDLKLKPYDFPMVLWCISPILTSISNQIGIYDGFSGAFDQTMQWGIPYLFGRLYFTNDAALRDLIHGILIGGIVYSFLCLYEIRMSPRLSINIYGFFPHEWRQHIRYGGWRPIVFMQHGIMVAVWMAVTATTSLWLWRNRIQKEINGIPIVAIVILLFLTTVLCKSASGWVALCLGYIGYILYKKQKLIIFSLLILIIPIYIMVRISGTIPAENVERWALKIFDQERVESLSYRLEQEDLFASKALERPVFGWGGYNRGWPVDPITGRPMIGMVDSSWTIYFNQKGFFGIFTWLSSMLIGPWIAIKELRKRTMHSEFAAKTMIALVVFIVVIFMIDSLFNGMVNPIYIMCSGVTAGYAYSHISLKKKLALLHLHKMLK